MCVATEDIQKGNWILDSSCTFHMSPYKSHEFNGRRVMMGNNSVCKVIGMGKIHLKLHDESIKEVRRHILELKKNLISLGMMDQMRCSIKLE